MKKIIYSLIALGFFATTTYAQEAFDKKMQFGIAVGTGFNMNKTSTLLDREGTGFDQTLGLNFNYNINPTLTITSGLEFDFESFKYTPRDSVFYYYQGNEIVQKENFDTVNPATSHDLFMLQNRQYKVNYLTIPVFMTLKTKPFGNLQYFGKFGARFGFKVGGRINDDGFNFAGDSLTGTKSELTENSNMVLDDDIRFLKINAGIAGGAMWNFSGTTMLVGEIGYFFGLSQIHYAERAIKSDDTGNYTLIDAGKDKSLSDMKYAVPQAKQGQILIKFTLFF